MAKEWILNQATNRFQFNFKRNVGAVAAEIRACEPRDLDEWREFYFANVRSREHIEDLGRRLYVKISEVLRAEIDEISEDDCVNYLLALVIDKTFDGYETEKTTVYGQLEELLAQKIEPAPDEWDRGYNVDFVIRLQNGVIGLQIKPVTFFNAADSAKWRDVQAKSHAKWLKKFGGEVFTVASVTIDKKKKIANREIIPLIQAEITRLS